MSISEKVLDAIQILADNSVKKADYDRTIQAQILSCEDATIGKYRCRYQDAVFYAYSNNTDITYSNGALVYILVPGNDFKKEKTILGTTKKLGINYITQAEGDQAYDIIGTNGIEEHKTFYLDTSYKNYSYTLYRSDREKNDVNVNQQALQRYIRMASSIIVGATIKTSIDPKRQTRGHYGITYNLKFIDNATGLQTIRSYTLDEDNMVDQPYRLLYPTRQIQIYNVDGANFVEVDSIELFCKDFPESVEHANSPLIGAEDQHDIQLTLFELVGASRMTEGQINGVAITFYTPQGTFFPAGESSGQKLIKAQVRVKGKLVAADQRISFYWGKQNLSVTPSSPYYNKYLGRGWKCINSSNVIDSDAETQAPITIEWIPGKDTYIFNYNEATAKDNWLKVAIVYDGNVISKKINIQNLADKPYPIIESSDGTKFYYDIGHPTLTAKVVQNVNGQIKEIDYKGRQFHYYWAYEDNTGNLIELPQIFGENSPNSIYNKIKSDLDNLKDDIQKNKNANDINELKEALKQYDFIQRVQKNQIHDVQIRNITSFGTFKCSVIQRVNDSTIESGGFRDDYIGTAQITLTNSLDGANLYSLIINNGSTVYQYNENGISPNNKSLDMPQQISALTFTVYDDQGKPLDSNMIVNDNKCKVRWKIPTEETLLVDEMPKDSGFLNAGYMCYDDVDTLMYNISNRYDIKKQNNQIQLTVDYKGMSLNARTNFTFAKQGEPGTNGTEYIVKIVPNTQMNNPPLWPVITKNINSKEYWLNYGVGSPASFTKIGINTAIGHPFKAQLWQNGEQIWQGYQRKDNYEGVQPDLIHWEVLKNVYKQGLEDYSALKIDSQDKVTYLGEKPSGITETNILKITGANIIKCSITYGGQGKTYYGTLPVTTAQVLNENYRIGLRDFTGFRHVLYTSDGINPQYDNSHPFEFYCEELINNVWEDVSNVQGEHQVTYDFSAIGDYQSYDETYTSTNANLLTILGEAYRKGLTPNQCPARPAARYDGQCVNVAICCEMTHQNGEVIGKIKVPIHYLLNKFGLSHINDWDGNSIQVNTDGGYILSPQMGAGVKNSSNQFTGVLMGEVVTPNKKESDIGLLGYANGDRTIFLNSRNGSAIFGKANKGQIVIDPSQSALLYSGNFWESYDETTGLPSSYVYRNPAYKPTGNAKQNEKKEVVGAGLLIDLSTPEIYFGTGNFYVTADGYLHAAGGGDIAGWQISDTTLKSKSGGITLDSSGKIYSGEHNALIPYQVDKDGNPVIDETTGEPKTINKAGFYLAADGLSIGDKFKISNQGRLRIGYKAVEDTEEKNNGKYWDINGGSNLDNSYISCGGIKTFLNAIPVSTKKTKEEREAEEKLTAYRVGTVYIGTDGITLGKRFSVSDSGKLIAYSGTIGGWTLNSTQIFSDKLILDKSGWIRGGDHAVNNGEHNSKGWSIQKNGDAYFYQGKIGGWTIGEKTLQAGNVIIDSNGSIHTPNWSINSDGTSNFSNITTFKLNCEGKIGSSGSLSGSGMSMGGKGIGSTIAPASVTVPGGSTLKGYISQLIVDDLKVCKNFQYSGYSVKWRELKVVTNVQSNANGYLSVARKRLYVLGTDSWVDGGGTFQVYSGGTTTT